MGKVKGEANSWALTVCAKANACPSYADAMRCDAMRSNTRLTHSLAQTLLTVTYGTRKRLSWQAK
jgi:hypothetical protein